MTEQQHPLTDDIIQTLWGKGDPSEKILYRLARAAYDQAVEHCAVLHGCLVVAGFDKDPDNEKELVREFAIQFKQTMRPQQQENN